MTHPLADPRVDELLQAVRGGDRHALDELFALVYEELRLMARGQRRRWLGNPTLNATAIVHEVYIKLVEGGRVVPRSRTHFFAAASKAMRHILSNYARDRLRLKRGGGVPRVSVDALATELPLDLSYEQATELTALDDALTRLEAINERQSQIVECRFFGGMNVEDTAAALGLSAATVKRDWAAARTWLYKAIRD